MKIYVWGLIDGKLRFVLCKMHAANKGLNRILVSMSLMILESLHVILQTAKHIVGHTTERLTNDMTRFD